ncbi:hypothetical protein QEZ54_04460 [Catellatospora sp. KI3]|uniref:hypothetical protein n=1 Tax=Catellatospora sp. KI3 TaxID=3041620 RepID=UPI00248234F4|nr:hypothetical protein [Catellatospora sp. KI3]MDI1460212.1 hypothetical protein [Catellatospora sp. KI3]
MNESLRTRFRGTSLLPADALGAVAGLALVGSTFLTTYVVDLREGRFVVPPGLSDSCTAWTRCPGNEFTLDYSGLLGWVVLLAALLAVGLPVIRALTGWMRSRAAASWQLFILSALAVASAIVVGLTVLNARVAGYQETNYQFYLKTGWGTLVMLLAMIAALFAALLVKVRVRSVD